MTFSGQVITQYIAIYLTKLTTSLFIHYFETAVWATAILDGIWPAPLNPKDSSRGPGPHVRPTVTFPASEHYHSSFAGTHFPSGWLQKADIWLHFCGNPATAKSIHWYNCNFYGQHFSINTVIVTFPSSLLPCKSLL